MSIKQSELVEGRLAHGGGANPTLDAHSLLSPTWARGAHDCGPGADGGRGANVSAGPDGGDVAGGATCGAAPTGPTPDP